MTLKTRTNPYASPQHLGEPEYWLSAIFCGLFANLVFFLGPAVEGYGKCLRLWHSSFTILLFLAGLGFTALLVVASVLMY